MGLAMPKASVIMRVGEESSADVQSQNQPIPNINYVKTEN